MSCGPGSLADLSVVVATGASNGCAVPSCERSPLASSCEEPACATIGRFQATDVLMSWFDVRRLRHRCLDHIAVGDTFVASMWLEDRRQCAPGHWVTRSRRSGANDERPIRRAAPHTGPATHAASVPGGGDEATVPGPRDPLRCVDVDRLPNIVFTSDVCGCASRCSVHSRFHRELGVIEWIQQHALETCALWHRRSDPARSLVAGARVQPRRNSAQPFPMRHGSLPATTCIVSWCSSGPQTPGCVLGFTVPPPTSTGRKYALYHDRCSTYPGLRVEQSSCAASWV